MKRWIICLLLVVPLFVWARAGMEPVPPGEGPLLLEVWGPANAVGSSEPDGPYSKYLMDEIGVGFYKPKVPWEGGTAYLQQLNIRLASKDLPDVFQLYGGIESELIAAGAIADLTKVLPKYAPFVYKTVPKEVWSIVRIASPDNDKLYFIPMIGDFPKNASYIRKDWLDKVGMDIPATMDEYTEVMEAFRDQDANDNGDPNDELPVTGRELGRWMDHLFLNWGVAIFEGWPDWDISDGQITYSAVTDNMTAAVQYLRDLFSEKLLDQETFLNKRQVWMGKLYSNLAGSYFWDMSTPRLVYNNNLAAGAKNPEVALLPPLKNPGYNSFFHYKPYRQPLYAIANKGERVVEAGLKYIEWMEHDDTIELRAWGLEGLDYEVKNGVKVALPPRAGELGFSENVILRTKDAFWYDAMLGITDEERPGAEMTMNGIEQAIPYGKYIASTGMPASVYGDYADIKGHKLYTEYLANIVIGTWDISKWDEFIDKWNASGGKEVTANVRAWYAKVSK